METMETVMTLREWLKQPKSTQKYDRPHTTFLLSLVELFDFGMEALAGAYLVHGCLTGIFRSLVFIKLIFGIKVRQHGAAPGQNNNADSEMRMLGELHNDDAL